MLVMTLGPYVALAFDLFRNAALVLLGTLVYCQVREHLPSRIGRAGQRVASGVIFGATGLISMLTPVAIATGGKLTLQDTTIFLATGFAGSVSGGLTALVALSSWMLRDGLTRLTPNLVDAGLAYGISLIGVAIITARGGKIGPRSLGLTALAYCVASAALAPVMLPPAAIWPVLRTVVPVWASTISLTVFAGAALIRYVERTYALSKAYQQSEERFRALVEYANDTMQIVDRNGTVIYRSSSATHVYGIEDIFVYGRPIFDRIHPDDVPALSAALVEIRAAPERRLSGRTRVRHQDGRWRYISWTARNALDVPGINGIIINSRDVTEAQRLEEELLQSQRLEAVGRLAGGIAHDFNNILAGIMGFAHFLVEDLPETTPQYGFAQRILKAGERARDLVGQILAFARQTGMERQRVDLAGIVTEVYSLLRASLPASTRLDIQTDGQPLIAEVNAAQITQILLNLCINANHALASEPGTIKVSLGPVQDDDPDFAWLTGTASHRAAEAADAPPRVSFGHLTANLSYAKLEVVDSGHGIEPAILGQIFEPFFTTRETGKGTGLGLSVVHGIVTAYGGACVVTSRPRHGASFAIYLPLASTSSADSVFAPPPATQGGTGRIMLVDDEQDIRDMLTIGLGRLGYEVVAIGDPLVALDRFAMDPGGWPAVISDQAMPHMKGLALLDRMKRIDPAVRFILCTGFGNTVDEAQALQAGADAFLLKPVSVERLATILRASPIRGPAAAEPSADADHLI
jgi:PAS domain S-box-containing protein